MNTSEFQTEPNRLSSASDGVKDLTLSNITEACPEPEKLGIFINALRTFFKSSMTSSDISRLLENICKNEDCDLKSKCGRVLSYNAFPKPSDK